MRLMQKGSIPYMRMVSHEGKTVVIGLRSDGQMIYSVRRDGFEDDDGVERQLENWENWNHLPLPGDQGGDEDTSVHDFEKIHRVWQNPDGSTRQNFLGKDLYLTRSRYASNQMHAVAPIAVVSAMGLLHVFRTAREVDPNSDVPIPTPLLVDRFVLDGMSNRLVAKLDLRYRRSRLRHTPLASGPGSRLVVDSLDFRDANDQPFVEPTTECHFVDATGGFSVELVPAGEPEQFNWLLVTRDQTIDGSIVVLTSVRADEYGGFDLTDRDNRKAIERRVIHLPDQLLMGPPAIARFDRQSERRTATGEKQWLRVSTSLMVAVPSLATSSNSSETTDDLQSAVLTWQLPVRADGSLAAIAGEESTVSRIRGQERQIPLAPDTLHKARPVTQAERGGVITTLKRGDDGEVLVEVADVPLGRSTATQPGMAANFDASERVVLEIDASPQLDGSYFAQRTALGVISRDMREGAKATYLVVRLAEAIPKGTRLQLGDAGVVTTTRRLRAGLRMLDLEPGEVSAPQGTIVYLADTFSIPALENGLGHWQDTSAAELARVDGQILQTSLQENQIRIQAPGHGLNQGDQVEIVGLRNLNGSHHAVRQGNTFVLDRAWPFSEAVNVKRLKSEQKGLVFAHANARIVVENGGLATIDEDLTLECWVRTTGDGALIGWFPSAVRGDNLEDAIEPGSGVWLGITNGLPALHAPEIAVIRGSMNTQRVADGNWHHVGAVLLRSDGTRTVTFVVDGVASSAIPIDSELPSLNSRSRIILGATDNGDNDAIGAHGAELADVRIWQRALSANEVAANAQQAVHHGARDLAAFWRLGAVLEGKTSTAVDATNSRNDGEVIGLVWPTPVTLARKMADGSTDVSSFENASLIGVAQGGQYHEEIEVRFVGGEGSATLDLWGQTDRYQTKRIQIDNETDLSSKTASDTHPAANTVAEANSEATGDAWQRLSIRFTIPDGITVLRAFGIKVDGNWTHMELRRHKLSTNDSITTERVTRCTTNLTTIGQERAGHVQLTRTYESLEMQSASLNRRLGLLGQRLDAARSIELRKKTQATVQRRLDNVISSLTSLHDMKSRIEDNPRSYWMTLQLHDARLPGRSGYVGCEEDYADRRLIVNSQLTTTEINKLKSGYSQYHWIIEDAGHFAGAIKLITRARGRNNHGSELVSHDMSGTGLDLRSAGVFLTTEGTLWQGTSIEFNKGKATSYKGHFSLHTNNKRYWLKYASESFKLLHLPSNFLYMPENFFATPPTLRTIGTFQLLGLAFSRLQNDKPSEFTVKATNELHDDAQRHVDRIVQSTGPLNTERRSLESEIQALKDLQTGGIPELQRKIDKTSVSLQQVDTELAGIRSRFVNATNNSGAIGRGGGLSPANDIGLPATGARLVSAQAVNAVNLFASATGDVLLGFQNTRGQVRQLRFDAVSDSRNATSDQWVDSSLPMALTGSGHCELPDKVFALGNHWTVESWTQFPLVEGHRLLATRPLSGLSVQGIGIRDNRIVAWTNESTVVGDLPVNQVPAGWHHVAIVAGADEQKATLRCYIDGLPFGSPLGITADAKTNQMDDNADPQNRNANVDTPQLPVEPLNTIDIGAGLAELRFWDGPLDAEEIRTNSQIRLSGREPGLRVYCPLNNSLSDPQQKLELRIERPVFGPCTAPIGNPGQRVAVFDGRRREAFKPALNARTLTLESWIRFERDIERHQVIATCVVEDPEGFAQFVLMVEPVQDTGKQTLRAVVRSDTKVRSTSLEIIPDTVWHHILVNTAFDGEVSLWLDEKRGSMDTGFQPLNRDSAALALSDKLGIPRGTNLVGGTQDDNGFRGELAEFRVRSNTWNPHHILIVKEKHHRVDFGLAFRLPFDQQGSSTQAARIVNDLPIAGTDIQLAEYPTYGLGPSGEKVAILRRATAIAANDGVELLAQQRIEALDLAWIGNAQFEPTLLGFIEGAPPVPSENLTAEPDAYNDATSVSLSVSEEVNLSWNRSKETTHGFGMDFFAGYENEWEAGATVPLLGKVLGWKAAELRAGLAGSFGIAKTDSNETGIAFSSSVTRSDSLALRGHAEEEAEFAELGARFVPKNIGYALVVAGLADVFVSRLATSGRMVGYQIIPVNDVPPDVSTITFLINPAYTMNGSLDGMTGREATSQRYFSHVPEARLQFGSLYPASYFRLQEAYELRTRIRDEDKRREAFFANFSVNITGYGDDMIAERIDDPEFAPKEIEVNSQPTTTGADGTPEPIGIESLTEQAEGGKAEAQKKLSDIKDDMSEQSQEKQKLVDDKKAEIERLASPEKREHASASFQSWQNKMEDLQIRAGKHNVVNSYVWDADGGLRVESEEYAATVEHTVGSALDMEWGLGADIAFNISGFKLELSPMYQGSMSQTLSKTRSTSSALSLEVDLSGLESNGVTDFKDRPLLPGSKVDRYRFMSFYLDGAERNFDDFFNYVVDPEWLSSNDEEARALRQTKLGAKSKPWRVLHRVTQVERPVLTGFGHDTRPLSGIEQPAELELQLYALEQQIAALAGDNARFSEQLYGKIQELKQFIGEGASKPETDSTDIDSLHPAQNNDTLNDDTLDTLPLNDRILDTKPTGVT